MNTPNLLVITGNQLRHRYFVNQLNFHFPLSAVFIEHFEHPETAFKKSEEKEGWNQFFIGRRKTEEYLLSCPDNIPAHPYEIAMEVANLAPHAETTIFPWKDSQEHIDEVVNHARRFLKAHEPITD